MNDLVTVFETGDPALVALTKSLLDSDAIDYTVKGEAIQDLLGVGRFPGGANLVAGPVVFQVRSEDAERARAVLQGLQ